MTSPATGIKKRDWFVTLYPIKYEGATYDAVESAEQNWLHEREHGIIRIDGTNHLAYICGNMERGGKGDKLHCHYVLCFENPVTFAAVKKLCGRECWIKPKHKEGADAYCQKHDATWVAGPWIEGEKPPEREQKAKMWVTIRQLARDNATDVEILDQFPQAAPSWKGVGLLRRVYGTTHYPDPLAGKTLSPYQQRVISLMDGPPVLRRMIWIWSSRRDTGKTALGKCLMSRYNGVKGSLDDPRSVTYLYKEGLTGVVVYDLPREKKLSRQLLTVWEQISDGAYIDSDKYEPVTKILTAHLVIFTNHPPMFERFGDRIYVIEASRDPSWPLSNAGNIDIELPPTPNVS